MVNTKKFPRGILDQAISLKAHDGERERAPDPGQSPKQQATSKVGSKASSLKQQATSVKHQAVQDD